ncbi:MAG TPA: class I SAM-dependent methyltransferase [Opitutaceae bacterium]|nr:class I SAM-dependent methyltransferase [Opitutaceae bacterium]
MDPAEYANLERVEQDHWYYAGKRELARWWLERHAIFRGDQPVARSRTEESTQTLRPQGRAPLACPELVERAETRLAQSPAQLQSAPLGDGRATSQITIARGARPRLLDCGAGTGCFAAEMTHSCEVWALDDHEESLALLRKRLSPSRVLALDSATLPAADASFEIVTALDVLEHIPDDVSAVREIRRVLAPGGVFLATVPALMALWSDWDEALHHQRRYSRRGLVGLFPPGEWEVLHANYTNVLVFPLVWAIRKGRRLFGRRGGRSEDAIPARPINAVLKWLFVATGKLRLPFPFGVSLLIVARRT